MNCGSFEITAVARLEAGRTYKLEVYQDATPPPLRPRDNTLFPFLSGLRIGCLPQTDEASMIADAVMKARGADVTILVVSHNNGWEREGVDRSEVFLPRRSEELIHAVCAVNANTIVINQSRSPVSMIDWVQEPAAIIQAWYQGQENGNAIADVLLGVSNPSGKLPVTFPKKIEDHGNFEFYPGDIDNDKSIYGERSLVGYKWFDLKGIEPLFEFGFGMSYTTFQLEALSVSGYIGDEKSAIITMRLKNTGQRPGSEVVQAYVEVPSQSRAMADSPIRSLRAFEKVSLDPGRTEVLTLELGASAVEWFDMRVGKWRVDAGNVNVAVGTSSRNFVDHVKVGVKKSWTWI